MSGTVCCYSGCKKSYSSDKDVSFFKFPDDPKRRQKWIQHCGNLELGSLSDRQFRGKRICSDHFRQNSFIRPESRSALKDSALPVAAKVSKKPEPTVVTVASTGPALDNDAATSPKSPTTPSNKKAPPTAKSSTPKPDEKVVESPVVEPTPISTRLSAKAKKNQKNESEASPVAVKKVSMESVAAKISKKPPPSTTVASKAPALKKEEAVAPPKTPTSPPSNKKVPPPPPAADPSPPKLVVVTSPTDTTTPVSTPLPAKSRQKRKIENQASPVTVKKASIETTTTAKVGKKPPKSASVASTAPAVSDGAAPTTSPSSKETPPAVKSSPPKLVEIVVASPTDPTPATTPLSAKSRKKPKIESQQPSPLVDKKVSMEAVAAKISKSKKPKLITVTISSTAPASSEGTASPKSPTTSSNKKATPATNSSSSPPKLVEIVVTRATDPAPVSTPLAAKPKKKVKVESSQASPLAVKKVSMEAMMAAVSSTKVPVPVSNSTPAKKVAPRAQTPPKLELSTVVTQPKAQKPAPKPSVVEIVREKPRDGNNTVVVVRQGDADADADVDNASSESDSYDEYMYYDREFDFEHEEDTSSDREFERFWASLKKYLRLPGKWTIGGVQWDPQGKRKVVIISEPEIPPNGRPCVKRCLQCFEDKSIRVFIDQMDMTDVFGMTCYAEKEDVAGLINRVAEASSCCGVPEMVVDDLVHFPNVRKRNTSYFDPNCPGVISNDAYDPICTACKDLQVVLMESREIEKKRLYDRRIRSEQKEFQHPFGQALYSFFNDLADETDPSKPKKKRTKETFFRKFLHDTRYKVTGDTSRTERVYIEKPISVDSVSQSFQDIVSKLGFNMPNAKKRPSGGLLPRPTQTTSTTPKPTNRLFSGGPSSSNVVKIERKLTMPMEHILPFNPAVSSFTLDDGQEYELIGEVSEMDQDFVEMKPIPTSSQQQQHVQIIQVDNETMSRLASSKNQVVMLPDMTSTLVPSDLPVTTRIDANDPNLSQILKAINTSHGFKV